MRHDCFFVRTIPHLLSIGHSRRNGESTSPRHGGKNTHVFPQAIITMVVHCFYARRIHIRVYPASLNVDVRTDLRAQ